MGICSSCLGFNRDRLLSDNDENSRLLFDDPHTNQYGSFGDQNTGVIQADPQELQRENEALQKVVAQTSNHLVDIFAMVPQSVPPPPTSTFPVHDARLSRYQDVLAKLSTKGLAKTTNQQLNDGASNPSDGWLSDDDNVDDFRGIHAIKSETTGPLLGGFADAESVD